jgi:predicted ATP-grasp superfamily ATP-dependent carboligase
MRLFKAVGYHGLGYVEMKRDERTGKHYIIEPNIGRPTGRSAIAETGGVALLYTMYCDQVGFPLPTNRVQQYGHAKWVHLRRDFQSAFYYWRRKELTLRDWRRSWHGIVKDAVFDWKDPKPFLGELFRSMNLFVRRTAQREPLAQNQSMTATVKEL